MITIFETKK